MFRNLFVTVDCYKFIILLYFPFTSLVVIFLIETEPFIMTKEEVLPVDEIVNFIGISTLQI